MEYKLADKGIRFSNYLIDIFFIVLIEIILLILLPSKWQNLNESIIEWILLPPVYFAYYFLLEYFFDQTIGKMATKSFVVYKNRQKPKMIFFIIRTFIRICPLDSMSILLGTNIGMHDLLSNTRVVRLNNKVTG